MKKVLHALLLLSVTVIPTTSALSAQRPPITTQGNACYDDGMGGTYCPPSCGWFYVDGVKKWMCSRV